jgi:hypothetical protein
VLQLNEMESDNNTGLYFNLKMGYDYVCYLPGARGGVVFKALRYKPDGVIGIFQWHNPSSRTMALGSTQPLTEMSTMCTSWG